MPKGSQSEPRSFQKHHLRNRVEKVRKKEDSGYCSPEPFLIKIDTSTIQKNIQNTIIKNMEINAKGMHKWSQNRCQKSMPKLVSKNIRKIMKCNVSLKGKIIEIHRKNNGFGCFRRLHVRTVKVSKKHQK